MDGTTFDLIVTMIVLMLFAYLSRELEIMRAINEVEGYLAIFKQSRDNAFDALTKSLKKLSSLNEKEIKEKASQLIEIALIFPVNLDPYGIVEKMRHILHTAEEEMEGEVAKIASKGSRVDVQNLTNLVEAVRALNYLYKVINHYYLIARKFKSLWLILQLNALLPFVLEEIKALEGAVKAFRNGLPIGDSAGPYVVASLARRLGATRRYEPVRDTEIFYVEHEGRKIYLAKAKGPGGTVGHLDDALRWVVEREDVSLLISVDAALKLEGEETGLISHGFGVAMGGVGVERFRIEEIATKRGIPLYAVLIKMSEWEASSIMSEKVYKAADKAVGIVQRVLLEKCMPGSTAVVLGVGNTIGVP